MISIKLIFSFEKWAAVDSILIGISSFLYAYCFIVLSRSDPESGALYSALFLLLTGMFSVKVMVHLYHKLRHLDEPLL